jgi:WD40 repeat protein
MHPLGLLLLLAVPGEPAPHLVLRGHKGTPECLACSEDGTTVAVYTCSQQTGRTRDAGEVTVYDARTGKKRRTIRPPRHLYWLTLSPDGSAVAGSTYTPSSEADRPSLWLWGVADGKLRASLQTPASRRRVHWACFSSDSRMLVSFTLGGPESVRNGQVGDARTGRAKHALLFPTATEGVMRAVFAAGQTAATMDWQGDVLVWDLARAKVLASVAPAGDRQSWQLQEHTLWYQDRTLDLSPGGRLVAASWGRRPVTVFAVPTGKVARVLWLRTDAGEVDTARHAAFSPDGKMLATAHASGRVAVWEVAVGRLRAVWLAHQDDVSTVRFAPSGRGLLSQRRSSSKQPVGETRVWDLTTLECRFTFRARGESRFMAPFMAPARMAVIARAERAGSISIWRTEELLKKK